MKSRVKTRILLPRSPSQEMQWEHAVRAYETIWDAEAHPPRLDYMDAIGYVADCLWETGTDEVMRASIRGFLGDLSDLGARGYSVQLFETVYLTRRPLVAIDRVGSVGATKTMYLSGSPEEIANRMDVIDVMLD